MIYAGVVGPRDKYLDCPEGQYLIRQAKMLVTWLLDSDITTVIVSGGADGIDGVAELTAREYPFAPEPLILKPETDPKTGRWVHFGAAKDRNTRIVTNSNGVYAFWNGSSTGTADTIRKALMSRKLWEVTFSNGIHWTPSCSWSPLEYGAFMVEHMFDPVRVAQALQVRYMRNRKSKALMMYDGASRREKLAYADGRTLDGFNWLMEGNRPVPGEGELEGLWLVASRNKKKEGVRPHQIGIDGGCNCDAVTKGHRACYAVYACSMWKWLVDPNHTAIEPDVEVLEAAA